LAPRDRQRWPCVVIVDCGRLRRRSQAATEHCRRLARGHEWPDRIRGNGRSAPKAVAINRRTSLWKTVIRQGEQESLPAATAQVSSVPRRCRPRSTPTRRYALTCWDAGRGPSPRYREDRATGHGLMSSAWRPWSALATSCHIDVTASTSDGLPSALSLTTGDTTRNC